VLVGRDLIKAAEIRAQISQIEKINAGVNTFRAKYNGLPGDLLNAANFGMIARSGAVGHGDGNGKIEPCDTGLDGLGYGGLGLHLGCETALFWTDLSYAKLIPDSLNTATDTGINFNSGEVKQYLPAAKIGNQNSIVVTSACPMAKDFCYWLLRADSSLNDGVTDGFYVSSAGDDTLQGMSPNEAYAVDVKMDNGLPQSGNVQFVVSMFMDGWFLGSIGTCVLIDGGGNPTAYKLTAGDTPNVCALTFGAQ